MTYDGFVLLSRDFFFWHKLLPSFGVSTSLGVLTSCFQAPQPPQPWMSQMGPEEWMEQAGWNERNGPSGFPHHRVFLSDLYCRSSWIPCPKNLSKNLDPTFPEWMCFFFFGRFPSFPGSFTEEGQQQKASKPWGCPVGFRSIFSKKKRSEMSLRWCKQSCTYWICMRAFDTTLFVEAISLNLQYSTANY